MKRERKDASGHGPVELELEVRSWEINTRMKTISESLDPRFPGLSLLGQVHLRTGDYLPKQTRARKLWIIPYISLHTVVR